MKINSIILENFRNYRNIELEFNESRNIIVGENAQGKTNLIEAIYLAAFAKSFRTNNSAELVMIGEDRSRVTTFITSEELEKNITIFLRRDGKKMIMKDGKALKRAGELLQNIVVIIFSPDDLRIIKDNPEKRRGFINRELSQIKPRYFELLKLYNEALREKNAVLKAGRGADYDAMLDIYDRQLADLGYELIKYRKEFVSKLSMEARDIMLKISGGKEELKIEYISTCDYIEGDGSAEDIKTGKDIIFKQLTYNRNKDAYMGHASIGPHRDDIEFYINGNEAKKYGSQGQQRTIALSLKLAEIRIVKKLLDEAPILLLDDVLSELDLDRQKFLVNEIDEVQLFITSAELNDNIVKDLKGGTLFRIEDGSVTRVDKY